MDGSLWKVTKTFKKSITGKFYTGGKEIRKVIEENLWLINNNLVERDVKY